MGAAGTALPAGLYKSLEPPFLSPRDEVAAPGLTVPQSVSSTLKTLCSWVLLLS